MENLLNGTPYEQYAIQNQILDKNNTFIEKKKGSSTFSFAFIYEGNFYGVWNDFNEGKCYVSKDYDPYSPYIYAVTLKDHQPNTMLLRSVSKYSQWKFFLENYKYGNVYYENQKIKKYTNDVVRMFLS